MKIAFFKRKMAASRENDAMTACLREAGHFVREFEDRRSEGAWDFDLMWIQGNANWFPRTCENLEGSGTQRPRVVLWHTEPLPPRPGSGFRAARLDVREIAKILLRDSRATDPYTNFRRIRRLRRSGLPDILAVSSRSRQQYLASRNIESHFIPRGYFPDEHGRLLGLRRTIDVLFLGTMQVRRRRKAVAQLARSGIPVRTEGSWRGSETWGQNRLQLLNTTKILLNLSRHPGEFAGLRMILGMCNGALVISEPMDLPEPYEPGKHYIETPLVQMPDAIRYYLEHPAERQGIVDEAYRFVTEKLTLRTSIRKILEIAAMEAAS